MVFVILVLVTDKRPQYLSMWAWLAPLGVNEPRDHSGVTVSDDLGLEVTHLYCYSTLLDT